MSYLGNLAYSIPKIQVQTYYSRLRPLSYRGADIFVLAFSLISRASYENVLKKWMPKLLRFSPNVPIVLIGTKLGKMTWQIGAAAYIECSSKTRQKNKPFAIEYPIVSIEDPFDQDD